MTKDTTVRKETGLAIDAIGKAIDADPDNAGPQLQAALITGMTRDIGKGMEAGRALQRLQETQRSIGAVNALVEVSNKLSRISRSMHDAGDAAGGETVGRIAGKVAAMAQSRALLATDEAKGILGRRAP